MMIHETFLFLIRVILCFIIQPYSYFVIVEDQCKKTLKKNPNNFYIKRILGGLYTRYNKFDNAIIVLEPLLQSGLANNWTKLMLSRAYFNTGKYEKVEYTLNKLTKTPDKNICNYYLGYSLIELGKIENGIKYLKIYLDHHPKDRLVFCKLGYEYYKQEKYDLALEAYKNAEKLSPLNKEIKDSIDLCVERIKASKKAEVERS